jgi:hypothetical protein
MAAKERKAADAAAAKLKKGLPLVTPAPALLRRALALVAASASCALRLRFAPLRVRKKG